MKKSSDLAIMLKNKSINDAEQRKQTNSNIQTPFNRTHIRHPIKEYFPSKIATGSTIQNTQSSIKSPLNSKPISLANAISLLSRDETNLNSRRNSRRLHTNQLKNILGKDYEKVSIDTVRFNTQFQNQQPLLHIFTHHNSPKKSLKTSPDTKQIIVQESFRNRISHKLSGHMYDKIELSQQPSESVRQRISTLKQKLRGNIQQRQFKLNNFTNHNNFKEDIEYKFQKQTKPTLPQATQIVLENYASQLTEYERSEIKDYETIYYLRPEDVKPHEESENNFGFDNEKGDYKFCKSDHIIYRYELLEQLGHGSFGYVFKVTDHKHQQQVALKIIKNKDKFHKQALIEIEILKVVNKADNSCCLIKLLNYFIFRNHVCMVFELLSCNLYEFLAINDFQGFELDLVRRFAIQLLQALLYLSECNIIHCDLKPENILLKDITRSGIKIIDFGSSCFTNSKLYTYIQSRFYRAPEILLGIPYSPAIDMWSFGCIIAELYLGNSLFQSKSEKELLFLQVSIVGKPSIQYLDSCPKKNKFFNANYDLITKIKDSELLVQLKPLKELLQNSSSQFIDFVTKCLQWDPNLRLKAAEALLHPWILEGLPQEIRKQHVQQMRYYVQQKNLDQIGIAIK